MYLKDMYSYICIVYLHCSVNFVDLLPLIISNNLRNLICMGAFGVREINDCNQIFGLLSYL